MNTFKRKALTTAVLGTLGAAGTAHAIYQNANGLGQALVYPYYTVQSESGTNSWNTYVSVVNTTTAVKIVKVRFREGKNSNEVLDFNLYLSPNDMWTGAVIPASSDSASQARLVTTDLSCTNPQIPAGGIDFRNYQYTGTANDGLGAGLDRTREGYFEMFEMGDLSPTAGPGTAAVHNQSASPVAPTCTGLRGNPVPAVAAAATTPTGGLSGTGTLINVNTGRDTMYNAIAFDQWWAGPTPASPVVPYSEIGNDTPNFRDTSPAVSVVVSGSNTVAGQTNVYVSSWTPITAGTLTATAGVRAASATMMHSDVINEYVLDAGTKSNTDWVLTFPTKRQFVTSATVITPFTNVLTTSGACETVSFSYFNREERSATASGVDFSPLPPAAAPNSLCWESTVVSIRNGSTNAPTPPSTGVTSLVLGSVNVTAVSLQDSTNFPNGWADLAFAGANAVGTGLTSDAASTTGTVSSTGAVATVAGAQVFHGLPVVGFMIRTFTNNNLSCGTATCQGNYGGSAMHNYRNTITP